MIHQNHVREQRNKKETHRKGKVSKWLSARAISPLKRSTKESGNLVQKEANRRAMAGSKTAEELRLTRLGDVPAELRALSCLAQFNNCISDQIQSPAE